MPGGDGNNDLVGACSNADWGIYNKIENGGKSKGMWRTLTKEEWLYLSAKRSNPTRNNKCGLATINGIYKGLVLLPDDWTLPNGLTFTPSYGNGYETNKYDFGEWQRMEAAGAVFLPITGRREGTSVDMSEEHGRYWLTTHNTETTAEFIDFQEMSISRNYSSRKWGQAVRLVRRVQKPLVQKGWVDMGLPSGTLWYSCNIGTTKPQGYGAYFAWGESRPKAEYTWETYQYGNASNSLTKYCYNASYGLDGYTDNLSTLELSDDAARAVMGGDARTPTESECNELMDNCTSEWTTYMGVNGWMLTSNTNGNRLFLPAAGQKYGSERDYDGVFCLYLT